MNPLDEMGRTPLEVGNEQITNSFDFEFVHFACVRPRCSFYVHFFCLGLCQDAKFHGHLVEMMYIQERGGMASDDAKILDHQKVKSPCIF